MRTLFTLSCDGLVPSMPVWRPTRQWDCSRGVSPPYTGAPNPHHQVLALEEVSALWVVWEGSRDASAPGCTTRRPAAPPVSGGGRAPAPRPGYTVVPLRRCRRRDTSPDTLTGARPGPTSRTFVGKIIRSFSFWAVGAVTWVFGLGSVLAPGG